jgi:hypothetical protein
MEDEKKVEEGTQEKQHDNGTVGTVFDLDGSRGTWFPYQDSRVDEQTGQIIFDDPKPGAGRVCVRPVGEFLDERLGKRRRKHEMVLNPRSRRMERVTYFDDLSPEESKKENEDFYDYAIEDFEDFRDRNKNIIPCNRQTKNALARIPAFDRFLQRCFQMLAGAAVVIEEERRGN